MMGQKFLNTASSGFLLIEELIKNPGKDASSLLSLLDFSNSFFLITSNDFKIQYVNSEGCKLLGIKQKALLGKSIFELFPKKFREETTLLFYSLSHLNLLNHIEIPVVLENGEERLFNWQNKIICNQEGKPAYYIHAGYDITRRSKTDLIHTVINKILGASDSEKNLDELFSFIHSCVKELMKAENFYIALYDRQNDMLNFSYFVDEIDLEAPPKKFGKGLTEFVITRGKSALINNKTRKELLKEGEFEKVGTVSKVWLGVPLKIKNKTIGALAVQDYVNPNAYGEKERVVLEMISYPISRAIERKIAETEKNDLINRLKDMNFAKDRLFSLISHDLRSPFNSLLGFSEILTTEFEFLTENEKKDYLRIIYESSKHLFSVATNLLHYSRFQMGKFDFNPEEIVLNKIVHKCIEMFKGSIVTKNLTVNVNMDKHFTIYADEDMLFSIIQNLLSNAIKFTPQNGSINVEARNVNFFEFPSEVEIKIKDTGVGISQQDLEKIENNQFYSTPGTNKESGTGLGLLLIKEFVNKHNGKFKILSEINCGSEFIFTLPLKKVAGEL
jgi:PAS domain S-box-containing protein